MGMMMRQALASSLARSPETMSLTISERVLSCPMATRVSPMTLLMASSWEDWMRLSAMDMVLIL